MPWTNAQAYCRQKYVDLSTTDTQIELDKFKNDVKSHLFDQSWIGLSKKQDQKRFGQWSDGTGFGFFLWANGQPDFLNTEHCVSINNSQFSNGLCSDSLPFICYTWEPTLIMVRELKTWPEALIHCRTKYTDLISLNTVTDILEVNKILRDFQNVSVWTGLNFMNGVWFWVNKEPLKNASLLPSCPTRPLFCGANVDVNLQNRDCMEKMNFICYQRVRYVCQLLLLVAL